MAVSCTKQPEHNGSLQEECLVCIRIIAGFEQVQDRSNSWPTFSFVFERWWNRKRLAAIFLRQAEQAIFARPTGIESLHHKHALAAEIFDGHIGPLQSKRSRQFSTHEFPFPVAA